MLRQRQTFKASILIPYQDEFDLARALFGLCLADVYTCVRRRCRYETPGSPLEQRYASHIALSDQLFRYWEGPRRSVGGIGLT